MGELRDHYHELADQIVQFMVQGAGSPSGWHGDWEDPRTKLCKRPALNTWGGRHLWGNSSLCSRQVDPKVTPWPLPPAFRPLCSPWHWSVGWVLGLVSSHRMWQRGWAIPCNCYLISVTVRGHVLSRPALLAHGEGCWLKKRELGERPVWESASFILGWSVYYLTSQLTAERVLQTWWSKWPCWVTTHSKELGGPEDLRGPPAEAS